MGAVMWYRKRQPYRLVGRFQPSSSPLAVPRCHPVPRLVLHPCLPYLNLYAPTFILSSRLMRIMRSSRTLTSTALHIHHAALHPPFPSLPLPPQQTITVMSNTLLFIVCWIDSAAGDSCTYRKTESISIRELSIYFENTWVVVVVGGLDIATMEYVCVHHRVCVLFVKLCSFWRQGRVKLCRSQWNVVLLINF